MSYACEGNTSASAALGPQAAGDAGNVECLLGNASGTERSFPKREVMCATAGSVSGQWCPGPLELNKGLLDTELKNFVFS